MWVTKSLQGILVWSILLLSRAFSLLNPIVFSTNKRWRCVLNEKSTLLIRFAWNWDGCTSLIVQFFVVISPHVWNRKMCYTWAIAKRKFICLFTQVQCNIRITALQVALKRQQAVEDAIAMRLVSNETGKTIDALPPGKIFGMSITGPCNAPSNSNGTESLSLVQKTKNRKYFCFVFIMYSVFLFLERLFVKCSPGN